MGRPRYGLVDGDSIIPVTGDPFTGYEPQDAGRRCLADLRWLLDLRCWGVSGY